MYNVDGTLNEAGAITEVVSLILHYKNHLERTTFAVCGLGKQKLILGHPWLRKHNPEIDWVTQEVKMSRCPPWSCPGCRDKAHQEHAAQKAKRWRNNICTASPISEISRNSDSSDEDVSDAPPKSSCIEEGDCILSTSLMWHLEGFPSVTFFSDMLWMEAFPSATIGASSTISQHLAEAFKANSKAQSPLIPEYLMEFTSVFPKKSFNILPEPKQWDHAVKIISGSKASNCKVYPLSLPEQKELDAFLKENLETGHI